MVTAKFSQARKEAFLAALRESGNQPFDKLRTIG
jgi:hypothetical protein